MPSHILNTVFLSKPQSCRFQPSSFWKTSAIEPQKPLVPRAPQPGGCGCLLGKWCPLPVILFLNSGSRTDRQSAPGCGRPTPWDVSHPPSPEARRLSAPRSVGLLAGGDISPRPESRSGEPSAPGRSSCQVGAGKTPHLVTVLQHRSGGSLHGGGQSVPHSPSRESPSLKATGGGAGAAAQEGLSGLDSFVGTQRAGGALLSPVSG